MTAAYAPAPWLRAAHSAQPELRFARLGRAGSGLRFEWLFKRNCSITPAQLFGVYLSLCVVSLGIALVFAWRGAPPVLAFAGVELTLVGVALLVYARHAADQELITLVRDALSVEHRRGTQTEQHRFRAAWVRVEPAAADHSLIELTGDGQTARIGRYLRPELRPALAQELRAALRTQRMLATKSDSLSLEPEAK